LRIVESVDDKLHPDFTTFPIIALVGENGAGKSTILQAAASVYRGQYKRMKFASAYFPDTPWETTQKAAIKWWAREGNSIREGSIRKETRRWRGNPYRRERHVENIDLSRIQPVAARVGYFRLAKPQHKEISSDLFDDETRTQLSGIMGRKYDIASMSLTDFDPTRLRACNRTSRSKIFWVPWWCGRNNNGRIVKKRDTQACACGYRRD
jgi:ATPase subunit of ABC transporter with duplicated ATPase domains